MIDVQKLLGEHGNQLLQALTGKAGFSAGEAQGFLPPAVGQILNALQGGGLDLGSLLGGGGLQSLLGKLDPGALAKEAGVGEAKARGGLEALAPELLSTLQGQAGGLEGLLGGKAGGLLGAAGKLFK